MCYLNNYLNHNLRDDYKFTKKKKKKNWHRNQNNREKENKNITWIWNKNLSQKLFKNSYTNIISLLFELNLPKLRVIFEKPNWQHFRRLFSFKYHFSFQKLKRFIVSITPTKIYIQPMKNRCGSLLQYLILIIENLPYTVLYRKEKNRMLIFYLPSCIYQSRRVLLLNFFLIKLLTLKCALIRIFPF